FRTVMFSISFGLIPASTLAVGVARERSPEFTGTPSITYNGAEEPDIDPTPRIRMVCIDPGCPDPPVDCSPGTRPCKALSTEGNGVCSTSLASTTAEEPVERKRVVVP